MDCEAWRAAIIEVTKSQTQLSDWTMIFQRHKQEVTQVKLSLLVLQNKLT